MLYGLRLEQVWSERLLRPGVFFDNGIRAQEEGGKFTTNVATVRPRPSALTVSTSGPLSEQMGAINGWHDGRSQRFSSSALPLHQRLRWIVPGGQRSPVAAELQAPLLPRRVYSTVYFLGPLFCP